MAVRNRAAKRGAAGGLEGRGPERRRDKLAQALLGGGLVVFMAVGVTACNTNPHAADVPPPPASTIGPAAGAGSTTTETHHSNKVGVQLPNTIKVVYATTPPIQDLAHHIVLWNASQAIKAEIAAAYEPKSAATPDLKRYWTGPGYTQAHDWAQAWIDAKQQPTGQVVISNVTVDSLASTQAIVGFCQDLTHVYRGSATTHTVGKALQEPNTLGTRVQLTMVPTGSKGQWQVSSESEIKGSPLCLTPSATHHKHK